MEQKQQKTRAPCLSRCLGCSRYALVSAWPKDSLARLFGLHPAELPLHAYWHAGLCDHCGIGLWNALSDHQRMHIKSAPASVFISRAAFNSDLAGAVDTLYRAVMHGSEITSAAINRARRVLRDYRPVVGEFKTNGRGNGDGDTRQDGPTKASQAAKQAQQRIVAATVESAHTGAQVCVFQPRDHQHDLRRDDSHYGAMRPRPKKAQKDAGKKKDAGKRARRELRFG